jgi:D-beta-D-heptose 7-phosphate kinase/D-beta-D-heptose 1-phosphate adenosyltransferase
MDLIEHFHACKGKNILVIGDVMVDETYYGTVRGASPEDPTALVLQLDEAPVASLGGAGNVAANVASLLGKSNTWLAGVVGCGGFGFNTPTLLEKMEPEHALLVMDPNRPTTTKTRYVHHDGFHHLLRTDTESRVALSEAAIAHLLQRIDTCIDEIDLAILSDYDKGVLKGTSLHKIIQRLSEKNIPFIVDPKKKSWLPYQAPLAICPNEAEKAACKDERALAHWVVVTRGAKGCRIEPGTERMEGNRNKPVMLATNVREVADTCGCGDSFIAALAIALAGGLDIVNSAAIANAAGAVAASHKGTHVVTPDELAAELKILMSKEPEAESCA